MRILIVEDTTKVAKATKMLLEEVFGPKVDVISVETGKEGLERFRSGFDVCIIDLRLESDEPEFQGARLLEKIRKIEKEPDWNHGQSKIIVQSAHITQEIINACNKYQIEAWVKKRHPSEFIDEIAKIVEEIYGKC